MNIALFITATGKYIEFLPKLLSTAQKYFMSNDKLTFVLFTDADDLDFPKIKNKIIINKVEKTAFPHASMNRCLYYKNYIADHTKDFDYCYAIDADAYFVGHVSKSVIADLVAVMHCGFINQRGSFETNKKSACYVSAKHKGPYLGGGFYGGSAFCFYYMNKHMNQYIEQDKANGIIPSWHDESALNRFFAEKRDIQTRILPPNYHYPVWNTDGDINPWVKNLWDKQKKYFKEVLHLDLPIDPQIVFIEKGNDGKGADYYRS